MFKYFKEIKNRIFLILVLWLSTFTVCYFYKEVLLFLVTHIFDSRALGLLSFHFIFTNVTEIFKAYLTLINFLSSQVIHLGILLFFYLFFSPAFSRFEHKHFRLTLLIILSAWLVSTILLNTVIIPITWDFFLGFKPVERTTVGFLDFHFEAKLSEYIDFYIFLYYTCLAYLESFALFSAGFMWFTNNNVYNIKKFRKLSYYFSISFSTFMGPPEIFSLMLISTIAVFICEFLFILFVLKSKVNCLVMVTS